jgi:hypothetical protein
MSDDQLSPDERKEIWHYYASIAPELRPARERLTRCRKEMDALGIPTALVLREVSGDARPATHVRIRGNFLAKGEEVSADVPAALV